jgi:two-component system, NarL family, response regulator NreC
MKEESLKPSKGTRPLNKSAAHSKPTQKTSKRPINILLADDHRILREGLVQMFRAEQGMAVIGEADDGKRTIDLVRELNPDVVIMEPGLHGGTGIETAKEILARSPKTKIIALSMSADGLSVLGMVRAGSSGYLVKDCSFEELAHAVRTVASGQTYLSSGITGLVVEDYVSRMSGPRPSGSSSLTSRERDVLRLIAEGRRTREIAETLGVSAKTVESHRRQMMENLNLSSIAALVKYAIREGLASL